MCFKKFLNCFKPKVYSKQEWLQLLPIDPDTLRMVEGILQLPEIIASEIMVPRSEMMIIHKEATLEEIQSTIAKTGHSRFPVIGENKDEVIGILLAKDLFSLLSEEDKAKFSLKDHLRPAIFIPENKPLNTLLHEFRKKRHHLAIIVDEYGGVSGLISIEDVLEQIVGDIEDEHDLSPDIYIRRHKDNYYSIKATTPIQEFNDFFNTTLKDDEFDTISGLILQAFGYLPKRGESIQIGTIPFTILRANSRRIQLLQTTLDPQPYREEESH